MLYVRESFRGWSKISGFAAQNEKSKRASRRRSLFANNGAYFQSRAVLDKMPRLEEHFVCWISALPSKSAAVERQRWCSSTAQWTEMWICPVGGPELSRKPT